MADQNLLLAALPADLAQRLRGRAEPVLLPAGRALYEVGRPVRHVYFVTGGLVSLLALTADGSTLELASVGREGLVGVPVILQVRTPLYLARVQIAGSALRLPADVFEAELRDSSALRQSCLVYADRLVGEIGGAAVCHHFHSVLERLCRWLLVAGARLGTHTIALTHEGMAGVLGAKRVAITRTIAALQDAEAVRSGHGWIEIVNARRLELSACACHAPRCDEFRLTPPPHGPRPSAARRAAA